MAFSHATAVMVMLLTATAAADNVEIVTDDGSMLFVGSDGRVAMRVNPESRLECPASYDPQTGKPIFTAVCQALGENTAQLTAYQQKLSSAQDELDEHKERLAAHRSALDAQQQLLDAHQRLLDAQRLNLNTLNDVSGDTTILITNLQGDLATQEAGAAARSALLSKKLDAEVARLSTKIATDLELIRGVVKQSEESGSSVANEVTSLKESVAKLIDRSKCSFRGTLLADGSCKCASGSVGRTCESITPSTCEALYVRGEMKNGMYEILRNGKNVQVPCVMDRNGGGWELGAQFGTTGVFSGLGTRVVFGQANNQITVNNVFKSKPFSRMLSTDAHYYYHSYCGAQRAYSMDWHLSGPSVGSLYIALPDGFSEYLVKYGTCYGGCVTCLYQSVAGGSRSKKGCRTSCGSGACYSTVISKYGKGDKLDLREEQGTCVGMISYILFR